jgi:Domain of unknown function (DUF4062)
MAKPRVFVSSTFYDLQHIRNDIESFIQSVGYEPVMFERGAVPYAQDKRLEEQCYAEISRCDILVSIIGDRFGAEAKKSPGSISQNELKRALDDGKQVYVFLLKKVDAAHAIYLLNKDKSNDAVDYGMDVRLLHFVDEVRALPTTGVHQFGSAGEITSMLREQWGGLFQELLARRQQVEQQAVLNQVHGLVEILQTTVTGLQQDRLAALAIGHPGIRTIREKLKVRHRAYVLDLQEFTSWMVSLGLERKDDDDDWIVFGNADRTLKLRKETVFQPGAGRLMTPPAMWDPTNVVVEEHSTDPYWGATNDEDIPF